VALPPGAVAPRVTATCTELLAALPDEIDPGVTRREVASDATRTAAWGEPPVELRCGVRLPERLSEPVTVNDVVWNVRDSGPGFTWTTTDRAVAVEVVVPDEYVSPAELVNPIATAVSDVVPASEPEPAPGA
jgi:hypothetical protein